MDFTLSDYYAKARARAYAGCFSLENLEYIWRHYGLGSPIGEVGLEFDFDKMRTMLNEQLFGTSALRCGDIQFRQIFSINYGLVDYVDRSTHRANKERAANPIHYAYLKDARYAPERELRITLSAMGLGRFMLNDGREIEFPPTLQLAFDYRQTVAEGVIAQVLVGLNTDRARLTKALARLGVSRAA